MDIDEAGEEHIIEFYGEFNENLFHDYIADHILDPKGMVVVEPMRKLNQ